MADSDLMLYPPPPPADLVDEWNAVEEKVEKNPGLRAALLWSLHGESLRSAAKRGGVDPGTLNHWLRRLGLHDSSRQSKQLVGTHRRVAMLASDEIERRLIEAPEKFKAAELNFITGTSTDKLAKFERWGEREPEAPSYASALEKLAAALAEGKVDLRIEVSRREPEAPAIDVPLLDSTS